MASTLLPGNLSFYDPELISKSRLVGDGLVFDPKMKEQDRLELLFMAIEKNALDVVQNVVESLSARKLSSPKLIMGVVKVAAANKGIDYSLLDFLDQHNLINRHNFIVAADENQNCRAYCWLLKDRKSIQLTEMNLPDKYIRIDNHGNKFRSAASMLGKIAHQGLASDLADLDIGYVIRNEKHKDDHEGANIFMSALRRIDLQADKSTSEDLVKLANVIWDPGTYRIMYGGLSDQDILYNISRGAKGLVSYIISDESDDLYRVKIVEDIVSKSPALTNILDRYWQLPQGLLLKNHPGKWSPLDFNIISEKLPGINNPELRDLLDCAIRCGSDWVLRSILEGGTLKEEIWRRLKEDDGPLVAGAIRSIEPSEFHKYVPEFVVNLGEDWKDAQGRGLGHYLIRAANSPTVEMLKVLAKRKEGITMLCQSDENGITALTFLEKHEDWKPQYKIDTLNKIKHKVLIGIANSQQFERKPAPKLMF